jgi:hypothetical protein
MKKQLIFIGLIALASTLNSQVIWNGSNPGTGYTSSTARIGGSTNPGTGTTFHVGDGSGTLHYTSSGSGGMIIKPSSGDRALLELQDPTNANRLIIQSLWNASYISNLNSLPLLLQTTGGRVGVGTSNPLEQLSVSTTVANDGISATQSGSGASALHLYNSTLGGKHWAILSTGSGNSQGSGNFSIYQYGAVGTADRLFIEGGTGNVGIGVTNTSDSKLTVSYGAPVGVGNRYGINSLIQPTGSTSSQNFSPFCGLQSVATTIYTGQNMMRGVYGIADGGYENRAGEFSATGGANGVNVGVIALSAGNVNSYGMIANAMGGSSTNWAGYFTGNVYGNYFGPSDRKLKENIKPLNEAIGKIKLLKPKTYTFKIDEFKDMNLPRGNQMGLIAQELEEVFPELIKEVADITLKDSKGNVTTKIDAHKSVNYTNLIPLLIAGIQEQQLQIEVFTKQLDEQRQLINELSQKTSNTTGINNLQIETGFQMSQNEPNPFTHETVVKYTLPSSIANAFMAVYDLTGKQITTFPIEQKGSSSLTITSEKLAAGIYIYSIVADGKVVDSKHMIVAEK